MPRLWSDTIESHRRDVRSAILDTTAALALERGVLAVSMSLVAQEVGIGRATLYKYFPSVEAILAAWHEATVARHLDELVALATAPGEPIARLHAVLEAYASIERHRHVSDLGRIVHHGPHADAAHRRLMATVEALVMEGTRGGVVREDVPAKELAVFCIHAAGAGRELSSQAALVRLVTVVVDGVRS